jgi:hypothetical protein
MTEGVAYVHGSGLKTGDVRLCAKTNVETPR